MMAESVCMEAKRFIFLDRDGVIIKDKPYIHEIADIEFLPNAIAGLLKIQQLGYGFIIITNQAGVARGYYTFKEAEDFHGEVVKRLNAQGVYIKKSYLCPHHPDFTGNCDCRKPRAGLIERAVKELDIPMAGGIFIGDKDCDIQLGKNCNGRTFLIKNGQYQTTEEPDFAVHDLMGAYNILWRLPK